MTTVAYRAGILAADSLGCIGSSRLPGYFRKLWRLEDGTIVGGCGDYGLVARAIAVAKSIAEIAATDSFGGSQLLCIRPDLSIVICAQGVTNEVGRPEFYAIGSGAMAALGALHAGASAELAVIAAARVDVFTDDRVHTLTLGGPAEKPDIPPAEPAQPALRHWWLRRGSSA